MKNLIAFADKYKELILNAQDYLWKHAETGYREWETSKYLEERYEELGYTLVRAGNIPGFYTDIDTGRPGPRVLILGELDALLCPDHPDAEPKTGAVHACGHCAQSAALLGIAAALSEKGATDGLCGSIRLCAVPAEELIEIEYRSELAQKGIIKYFGGKTEFLSRGYFDGVDVAFMVHTAGDEFVILGGALGCITKKITYKGKASHAGAYPAGGCNALYAATQGVSAINAIRETFEEEDIVRVHPIITHGGDVVNTIPDCVTIESYVRASSYDAIKRENKKVNRALCGAALSLGANVDIDDRMGYSPLKNDEGMMLIAKQTAEAISDLPVLYSDRLDRGSTDMGDLSAIMPVVHPYVPGCTGTGHGKDYRIAKPELACVLSAKWQLAMLWELLSNGASRAKKIIDEYEPAFASKKEFFEYIDSVRCSGDRITYTENNAAVEL